MLIYSHTKRKRATAHNMKGIEDMKVVQAIVIEKKTNKSVSFPNLDSALEYVSGNYHSLGIVYYDDKGNEYIY